MWSELPCVREDSLLASAASAVLTSSPSCGMLCAVDKRVEVSAAELLHGESKVDGCTGGGAGVARHTSASAPGCLACDGCQAHVHQCQLVARWLTGKTHLRSRTHTCEARPGSPIATNRQAHDTYGIFQAEATQAATTFSLCMKCKHGISSRHVPLTAQRKWNRVSIKDVAMSILQKVMR